MDAKVNIATGLSKDLQSGGELLQKAFGQVGDSRATGLAQAMKVFAGKVEHKAEDADAAAKKLGDLSKDASGLKDFTDPKTVTKAERIMEDIDESVAAGEEVTDELDKLIATGKPEAKSGAVKQYYPAMYFVDKEFDGVPSTSSGDIVAEPMVGSADACASACDANLHECVGFQFFKKGQKGACVLLSNFKTGFYYTGCGKAFLQTEGKAA